MKYLKYISFCFILLWIISCGGESTEYQPVTRFDPNRNAAQDLTLAIAEARSTNRNILLDVGGEWCIWCHKLDRFFEENPDINSFMHDHYVVLKINYSPENKNEEFLSQYPPIPGYPHFFVLDKDGKFVHSQGTGELETGDHHDREKIMNFLNHWIPDQNQHP